MHKVTLIPGDGIGPEVTHAACEILAAAGAAIEWEPVKAGLKAGEEFGTPLPQSVIDSALRNKLALKGPTQTPFGSAYPVKVGDRVYPSVAVALRKELGAFANVRPVKALADRLVPLRDRKAKDIDLVVFRENTEGIYVGMGGQFKRGTPDEVAINEDVNTRKGVERIIRASFDFAKRRGKKTVHMADKSNAMKHAHELWHRCFFEVAKEYPEIEAKHVYVDALCLYLVQDPRPFEVVVSVR